MAKTLPFSLRLDPEVKAALERAARSDQRSASSMGEKILREWLTERGLMEKREPVPLQVQFVNPADGSVTPGPIFK